MDEEFEDVNQNQIVQQRRSDTERRQTKFFGLFNGYSACSDSREERKCPEEFTEITGRSDKDLSMKAVKDELKFIDDNHVWKIVNYPKGFKL